MSTDSPTTNHWTDRLPAAVNKTVHRLAIASLVSQIGIIVTGGAVRLTKSGLGCSQWPNCVPGSMTPVPEQGVHGLIEFGNRTLTFVLVVIAVAFLVSIWRFRATHKTLFGLSIALLAGIPAQAIIGGITVLTKLNPWVVSLHFIVSAAMVMAATLLVNRTGALRRGETSLGKPAGTTQQFLAWTILATSALAIVLGTIVTGTGPHAGDADSPRHLFDPYFVTRLHVVPVYLLVAATLIALFLALRNDGDRQLRTPLVLMTAVVLLQGIIGYTQHFTGLPILLVLFHMLGASLLAAAAINVWDRATQKFPF
ncbi:COX15/CtaA family protein [Paeniglutamicibacter kerguelensis]|uniref:Cytochrome c oxidase assembly protein subunit 15 n=1 Tax=Paeniglutamicibacter kerguelensis TaxID=254788 RepID=A0ABS4XD94_9MICC|nr:COX15/CtaA family protein [Paeniglutamicibacter kerguelensis]MBP2386445.1 cytochrome c oxidase assembly protein subunit 15 [Paeniglutamicibacter kerguelensis]